VSCRWRRAAVIGRHSGTSPFAKEPNFTCQHFAHVPEAFGAVGIEVTRTEEVCAALTNGGRAARALVA
jgi:hypothetical protein